MEKLQLRLDCFEATKIFKDKRLEYIQVDLIYTRATVEELLSIVKCIVVENQEYFGGQRKGARERKHFSTLTQFPMVVLIGPHKTP